MSPLSPTQFNLPGSTPVTERVVAVDALRGLAVLGILWINILVFALPDIAVSNPLAIGGGGIINHGLWTFGDIYIEGTMRGLFSIMFGASIVLLTVPFGTSEAPKQNAKYFYRRSAWLVVFGLIHEYLLLMPYDILLMYGLAGFIIFLFRNVSPRTLLTLSAALLTIVTVLSILGHLSDADLREMADDANTLVAAGGELTESDKEILKIWKEEHSEMWPSPETLATQIKTQRGSVGEIYANNFAIMHDSNHLEYLLIGLTDVWLMMFLGMVLLKWRVLTAEKSRNFYLYLMLAGYGIGLPLNAWQSWAMWQGNFDPVFWYPLVTDDIGRVSVTLGHIGLFFSIWKSGVLAWLMRALTAVGRMALTNYISQTILANLIFTGIGFGLYGQFERLHIHLIMAMIWIFQITFSLWWLSRFQFGPLERGWRSLTYGKVQPFRLRSAQ